MTTKFNKPLPLKDFAKKVKAKQKRRQVVLEKTIEKNNKKYARDLGAITRKYVSTAHRSVPDDIFFFDNRISVYVEFKRPGKALTGNQARELYKLLKKGHLVHVFNNESVGNLVIDYYANCAEEGRTPPDVIMPSEKQWQRISKSKGRITDP